jgi:hypothetical protein
MCSYRRRRIGRRSCWVLLGRGGCLRCGRILGIPLRWVRWVRRLRRVPHRGLLRRRRRNGFGGKGDLVWRLRVLEASPTWSARHRRHPAGACMSGGRVGVCELLGAVLDVALGCVCDAWRCCGCGRIRVRWCLAVAKVPWSLLWWKVSIVPHGDGLVGRSGGHILSSRLRRR